MRLCSWFCRACHIEIINTHIHWSLLWTVSHNLSGKDAVATCFSSTAEIRGRGDMTQGQSMHTEIALRHPPTNLISNQADVSRFSLLEELIDR